MQSGSKKRFCRYQDDKNLIWRKTIKDGRYDPNFFPNFLKNWWSLGSNTCKQYFEHQINWKSGFADIRVARFWCAAAASPPPPPADETVQKQKAIDTTQQIQYIESLLALLWSTVVGLTLIHRRWLNFDSASYTVDQRQTNIDSTPCVCWAIEWRQHQTSFIVGVLLKLPKTQTGHSRGFDPYNATG